MKTNTLFKGFGLCLAALFLVSVACAWDTTLDTQGFGTSAGGELFTPHRYSVGSYTTFYFEYPGLINLQLAVVHDSSRSIDCSSLNISGGTQTWTTVLDNGVVNGTTWADTYNWSSFNITFNSNTGILQCAAASGLGGLYISPENSNITWLNTDYAFRSFTAGSHYTQLPIVNKWAAAATTVVSTGTYHDYQTSHDNSPLFFMPYTPTCENPAGEYLIRITNSNTSDMTLRQEYYIWANFTDMSPLNITSFTPSNQVTVALGGKVNFTVTANTPEAVSVVSWYKHKADNLSPEYPIQSLPNGYTLNYTFTQAGTYLIEVQLENWECHSTSQTVNFTVVVTGDTLGLEGQVTGEFLNGSIDPLAGATVSIINGSIHRTATTDADGMYSFANLAEGIYNVTVMKPGFIPDSQNVTIEIFGENPDAVFEHSVSLVETDVSKGSWNIQFLDGTKNTALSGFSFDLNSPYGLAAFYDPSTGLSDAKVYTISFAGNTLNISGIPLGETLTVSVTKDGFKSSSGAAAATMTKLIEVSVPTYLSTLYLYNITSGGSDIDNGSTVVGHTSLTVTFPHNVAVGDEAEVTAEYTYDDVPILGATCHYISNCDSYGSRRIYWDGSAYSGQFFIDCAEGTSGSIEVGCSKAGYADLEKTLYFDVAAEDEKGMDISYQSRPNPSRSYVNTTLQFRVNVKDTHLVDISGATCALVWNTTSYPLTQNLYGTYTVSFIATTAGAFQYYVQCNKTGYTSENTSTSILVILTNAPVQPTCSDGYMDYNETDTDCGGNTCPKCQDGLKCKANADCTSNYCLAGFCMTPSCSDGVKNGNETGIDCGGSCAEGFGMYCMCFANWDCDQTGSETCVNSSCIRDACTTTCPSIWWSTSANPLFLRERVCSNNSCLFRSYSPNQSLTNEMVVSPLAPFYYNNTGTIIYVSNCEQGNNGFKVTTNRATQKLYFFDYTALTPSVPASTETQSFDSNYALVASGTLPALCQIPAGSDYIFALTTFKAHEQGGKEIAQSVYSLTFRKAFVFNVTKQSGTLYINASRAMSCIYRTSITDTWSNVSGMGTVLSIANATEPNYYVACNSSYGEVYAATYGKGGVAFSLVQAAWKLGAGIGSGLFSGLFGVDFVFESWYLVPLAFIVMIGFPIMVILGYFMLNKRKQHG